MEIEKLFSNCIETPIGWVKIMSNESTILSITFSEHKATSTVALPPLLTEASAELTSYFLGKNPPFDFPIAYNGTDFQNAVWKQLKSIEYGKTINYLELAIALGDPKKTRAVAAANGANPFAIVVPCHRVIGKNGSMTGYAGGIWRKEWLLRHEGFLAQTALDFG